MLRRHAKIPVVAVVLRLKGASESEFMSILNSQPSRDSSSQTE